MATITNIRNAKGASRFLRKEVENFYKKTLPQSSSRASQIPSYSFSK